MAQNSGVLNRVKNIIPSESLKILYYSMIFPHYSYCLEAWGTSQPKNLKRIVSIQKKSIRAISRSHWLAHTEPRMKYLGILKLEDQNCFQSLTMIYNMLKGNGPDVFSLRQDRAHSSSLSLRSNTNRPNDLKLPAYHSNQFKRAFLTSTIEQWNKLPDDLQGASSAYTFKNGLKSSLFSGYKCRINCCNPRCNDQRFHNP